MVAVANGLGIIINGFIEDNACKQNLTLLHDCCSLTRWMPSGRDVLYLRTMLSFSTESKTEHGELVEMMRHLIKSEDVILGTGNNAINEKLCCDIMEQ